jgi:hypothetical protein
LEPKIGRSARASSRLVVIAVAFALVGCGAQMQTAVPTGGPTASPSASDQPTQPPPPPIVVAPSAVLMTARGQTARLVATATGADGAALPVAWSSSDSSQVSVDSNGNITALTDLGGALIFADAGDRTTPVAVLVAQPAANAILVSDEQVVSPPVRLGDPNALPAAGDQYRVSLSGIDAPSPGAILISTGGAQIGGRVVSSSASAGGFDVEYALVPLPQLLTRYSFGFEIPIDPRDAGLATATTDVKLASVGGAFPGSAPRPPSEEHKVEHKVEFEKGPLKCSAGVSATFTSTNFNITAKSNLVVQFEGRKEKAETTVPEHTKLVLAGPITFDIVGGLKASAGFSGSASCRLAEYIPIPIGGFLAVFLRLEVPIGVVATAKGCVKVVDVELGPKGHLGTTVAVGFECTNTVCNSVTDSTPDPTNGLDFATKVNLLADMRVEAGVGLNIFSGLGGNALGERISLIEAKIGPLQSLNLAFDAAQVRDTAYASKYDLKIAASIAPSEALKKAIELLVRQGTIDLSLKAATQPLSTSPAGRLSADKPRIQLGKPVTLSIDLDPKTIDYWPIGPNVDGLTISRWKDDALQQIATIPVTASGQTHFEYKWTPGREFLGMNELVAFVDSTALPGFPLEIAPDSRTKVEVVEACVPQPTAAPSTPGPAPSAGSTLAPSPTPAPTEEPCGSGTVTVSDEQHGDYTSSNGKPVHVDFSSSGTVTFDLVASADDPTYLAAETSSFTWTYSLTSTQHGEDCDDVTKGSGGGTWEGDGGPIVLEGFSDPDGTLFGMNLDEHKYVLQALNPDENFPDGDPRAWYQQSTSICGGAFVLGLKFPFSVVAYVDGNLLPSIIGSYSGSAQRTLPDNLGDLPITETITWNFKIAPPD